MASFNTDVDFDESRGVEINVIGWVFTGIAIATVGLKLFARGHIANKLGWDDFFIFFSMVGISVAAIAITNLSMNRASVSLPRPSCPMPSHSV